MKKALSILLVAVMCIAVLASCNLTGHEHVFATDVWSSDDDFHWHACTAEEGCKEQGDRAAHDFEVVLDEENKAMNKCKTCGATNYKVQSAPAHEHEFAEEFSTNENFHWHACTVEGCYEAEGKAEHAFGNPEVTYEDKKITIKHVCVDCEYEKIEEQEVKTEVDDAVSWDEAFKNFKLTNFTMDVNFIYKDYPGENQTNHCVVTEDSAYYCIPHYNEFYTVPNGDEYATYYKWLNAENFTLSNDKSNSYLIGAQTETVLQVSFENNFEKFTYDEETASYVCDEIIEAECYSFSGDMHRTLYCYNSVVKLTDGEISYISAEYYFEESELEEETKNFAYYNIGISAVEIPQSIIDGAVEEKETTPGDEFDETYNEEQGGSYDKNEGAAPEYSVEIGDKIEMPEEGGDFEIVTSDVEINGEMNIVTNPSEMPSGDASFDASVEAGDINISSTETAVSVDKEAGKN